MQHQSQSILAYIWIKVCSCFVTICWCFYILFLFLCLHSSRRIWQRDHLYMNKHNKMLFIHQQWQKSKHELLQFVFVYFFSSDQFCLYINFEIGFKYWVCFLKLQSKFLNFSSDLSYCIPPRFICLNRVWSLNSLFLFFLRDVWKSILDAEKLHNKN